MPSQKTSYSKQELLDVSKGDVFGKNSAKLPAPPMLMIDRITQINNTEGSNKLGYIEAEMDITPDLWFFDCHFHGDPVMPGCLGLDALWQLLGFFLVWSCLLGSPCAWWWSLLVPQGLAPQDPAPHGEIAPTLLVAGR